MIHPPEHLDMNKSDCQLLALTKSSLSQTLLYGNAFFDRE